MEITLCTILYIYPLIVMFALGGYYIDKGWTSKEHFLSSVIKSFGWPIWFPIKAIISVYYFWSELPDLENAKSDQHGKHD